MPPLCPVRPLFQLTPDLPLSCGGTRPRERACSRGSPCTLPAPGSEPRATFFQNQQSIGEDRLLGVLGAISLRAPLASGLSPGLDVTKLPLSQSARRGPTVHRGPRVALRREHGLKSRQASSHVTCDVSSCAQSQLGWE